MDAQPAGDPKLLIVERLDARRLEAKLGELCGIEEIGRPQVIVALGLVGVDRLGLDRAVDLGGREVFADLEGAREVGELAAYGGDAHVLDAEADRRVRAVDGPGAGRDQGRKGGCGAHQGLPWFERSLWSQL